MKRDLELIDRILAAIEAAPLENPPARRGFEIEGCAPDAVLYNLGLALSAGLVEEGTCGDPTALGGRWLPDDDRRGLWLTWKGHQHIDDRAACRK